MSKLVPLLRRGADGLERQLLESARVDAPPNHAARARTLALLKAASSAAASGAGAAAVGGVKGASVLGSLATKWFVISALGVSTVTGGALLVHRTLSRGSPVAASSALSSPSRGSLGSPSGATASRAVSPSPAIAVPASTPAVSEQPAAPAATPPLSPVVAQAVVPATPLRDPTPFLTPPAAPPAPTADMNAVPGVPSSLQVTAPLPGGSALGAATAGASAVTASAGATSGGAPAASGAEAAPHETPLHEETALLESVREALTASQADRALAGLDRYDARFPAGALREEAAVLRAEALLAAGRREDARRWAARFLESHPSSYYAPSMRALLARIER
jgi:hypothetical protein